MEVGELIGRRVRLAGHFPGVVRLEAVDALNGGGAFQLRVRLESGVLDETLVTEQDLARGVIEPIDDAAALVPGDELIEAKRIGLAFAHDPNFADSLSGIRGLPHQITAVCQHVLRARARRAASDAREGPLSTRSSCSRATDGRGGRRGAAVAAEPS